MDKAGLITWMKAKHQEWEDLIAEIDPARMEEPDVVGFWSFKDFAGHMVGWNRRNLDKLAAAQRGEPEPATPWPSELESDDEINAWFYDRNRERPIEDILMEERAVFEQHLATIEAFPDGVEIETVVNEGRDFYLLHWSGKRYHPGEFFDHFRDDHEEDIRTWVG